MSGLRPKGAERQDLAKSNLLTAHGFRRDNRSQDIIEKPDSKIPEGEGNVSKTSLREAFEVLAASLRLLEVPFFDILYSLQYGEDFRNFFALPEASLSMNTGSHKKHKHK